MTATNESFALTTTAATFPVTVGGTAPVNLTVTGTGSPISFVANSTTALPLTYSCTATPSLSTAEIACNFSPANGQSVTAAGVTLNLVTMAPTSQLRPPLGPTAPHLLCPAAPRFVRSRFPGGIAYSRPAPAQPDCGSWLLHCVAGFLWRQWWWRQHHPDEPGYASRFLRGDHQRYYRSPQRWDGAQVLTADHSQRRAVRRKAKSAPHRRSAFSARYFFAAAPSSEVLKCRRPDKPCPPVQKGSHFAPCAPAPGRVPLVCSHWPRSRVGLPRPRPFPAARRIPITDKPIRKS